MVIVWEELNIMEDVVVNINVNIILCDRQVFIHGAGRTEHCGGCGCEHLCEHHFV